MKLWVRSSDKMQLTEINNLSFKQIINGCWNINGNYGAVSLGSYPTRERCLEIIDEIQELLKLGNPENAFMHIHNCDMGYDETIEVLKRARETKAIITQGADFDVKLPSVVVYEMPEK